MDIFEYQKNTQDKIINELERIDFQNPDWYKPIINLDPDIAIWFLKKLVEKREYIDEIFALAKIYLADKDPSPEKDDLNKKIERGEEIRNIYTVRGNACWLLASLAATFRSEFYPEIISILEKLCFDPVYYIRIQATVPLSFFALNIRARQNKDGTVFDFKDEDRERIINLSFQMLRQHRDMPRVLEGVANVFNGLRNINELQAKQVIESFFYNSKDEIQPNYLTHQGVPLLLFFSEFREEIGKDFNSTWFKEFAFKVLELPEKDAPYVRSTFIWHVWKELQNNNENYLKFKKYISLFLRDDFELQSLGQYEFLVNEVIKISLKDGIDLFYRQLDFIRKWVHKYSIQNHSPWLYDIRDTVEKIAVNFPDDYLSTLQKITYIISQGMYIGDVYPIFKAYTLIPSKKKIESIKPEVLKLYQKVKQFDRFEKLPAKL